MCVCVCVCVFARASAYACACAYVRVCMHACVETSSKCKRYCSTCVVRISVCLCVCVPGKVTEQTTDRCMHLVGLRTVVCVVCCGTEH